MIRAIKWWRGSGTGETSVLPGIALIGLPVLLVMLVGSLDTLALLRERRRVA